MTTDSKEKATAPARKRGVRRSVMAQDEEVQVLIRLPQELVAALDDIATKNQISRTKAAQLALQATLRAGSDISTKSDIEKMSEEIKQVIVGEVVKSLKSSNSINQFRYLKEEIESLKKTIELMALVISQK